MGTGQRGEWRAQPQRRYRAIPGASHSRAPFPRTIPVNCLRAQCAMPSPPRWEWSAGHGRNGSGQPGVPAFRGGISTPLLDRRALLHPGAQQFSRTVSALLCVRVSLQTFSGPVGTLLRGPVSLQTVSALLCVLVSRRNAGERPVRVAHPIGVAPVVGPAAHGRQRQHPLSGPACRGRVTGIRGSDDDGAVAGPAAGGQQIGEQPCSGALGCRPPWFSLRGPVSPAPCAEAVALGRSRRGTLPLSGLCTALWGSLRLRRIPFSVVVRLAGIARPVVAVGSLRRTVVGTGPAGA